MTIESLQHKPLPVVVKMPKARSLTRFLIAIGVMVQGEPNREDIERAHRIFRGAKGQSVEVNNLWNRIKRHVCRICGGVKLREKSDTCSHHCSMRARLALLCVLCVSVANAQRGTLSAVSRQPSALIVAPTTTMFAPSLTVVQPPVIKTNLFYNIGLAWDAAPSAATTGYRIRYGTNTASAFTNMLDVSRVLTNAATPQFCTISNLAFKPTWYFQAFTLAGAAISEGSNIVPIQPPIEAGFVLSAVFPLYSSSNFVNWITKKIVTLVMTNPPENTFFRSHFRQLDYQWTNNQIQLRPFSLP